MNFHREGDHWSLLETTARASTTQIIHGWPGEMG